MPIFREIPVYGIGKFVTLTYLKYVANSTKITVSVICRSIAMKGIAFVLFL